MYLFLFYDGICVANSNLHNVMETDTTAAKIWYLICDNLPSVSRSSIFCQHKLKWVSGRGSISVRHVFVTYARLLISCNHQSKVFDSCSRCDPNRGAVSTLLLLLNIVCTYRNLLLSLQHTEVIFLSYFHWFPMKIKGLINKRTIRKSHYVKHIQHLPSGEKHFALKIPPFLEL